MRNCLLALAGMVVAVSSCGRRPDENATPKPDNAKPPAVAHSEVAVVADTEEVDLKGVASSYFEALFSGDADGATRLATTPFSLDEKKVLHNRETVESIHQSIVREKGKRPIPKYAISKTDKAPALDPDVFPRYAAFRIMIDGEHLDVYVSKEMPQKVIGIRD